MTCSAAPVGLPDRAAVAPVTGGGAAPAPTVDLAAVTESSRQLVQGLQQLIATLRSAPTATAGTGAATGATSGTTQLSSVAGTAPAPAASATTTGSPGSATTTGSPGSATTPSAASTAASTKPAAKPAAKATSRFHMGNLTPNQFDGLSSAEGGSACGPAAAIALARSLGKDPSMADTLAKAKQHGWNIDEGMSQGMAGEVKLLKDMGVTAHVEGVDWDKVKRTVQSGKPVIVGTPGHFWVAEGYDATTGRFDFGKSGSVFCSADGKHEYTPEEMVGPGKGAATSTIYLT